MMSTDEDAKDFGRQYTKVFGEELSLSEPVNWQKISANFIPFFSFLSQTKRKKGKHLHGQLAAWAAAQGEPVPSFELAREADLDALIQTPQKHFFGRVAYPTLEDKAAIIFYTINKRQIFLNGNKRMSTLALLVFLSINNRTLDIVPNELTEKALWLANTESLNFPEIKAELSQWIREHLRETA